MAQTIADKVLYRQLAVVAQGLILQRSHSVNYLATNGRGLQLEGVLFGISSWKGNSRVENPTETLSQRLTMLREGLEAFKVVVPPWILKKGSIARLEALLAKQPQSFRVSGSHIHHSYVKVYELKDPSLESYSTDLTNDVYDKDSYVKWAVDTIVKIDVPAPKSFPPKFRQRLQRDSDPLAHDPLVMETLSIYEVPDTSAIWIAKQILNETDGVSLDISNGTIRVSGGSSSMPMKETLRGLLAPLKSFVTSTPGIVQHMSLAWEDFSTRVTQDVAFPAYTDLSASGLALDRRGTHWMAATAIAAVDAKKIQDLQKVLQMAGAPISASIWKLKAAIKVLEDSKADYEALARQVTTSSLEVYNTYGFDPSHADEWAGNNSRLLGYWIISTLLDPSKVAELMLLTQTAGAAGPGADTHAHLERIKDVLPKWLSIMGDPKFQAAATAEAKKLMATK